METDAPAEVTSYTCLHVVGDLIGLLDVVAPNQDKVFVVGHDWGALISWSPSRKVIATLEAVYGGDYYMCRFQEPGEIEAEFAEIGAERVSKEFLTFRTLGPLFSPKGKGFHEKPLDTPIVLPSWLSEEDASTTPANLSRKDLLGD
ncbi:unnamed protein product [Dovyalis caffra]|uniref:Uncharacterized protein n=1 Tax=Dovyalis caffra TaxID=77055 RepID=A0AAV1RD12_9ROSI|nr:unnamed protein product [Dovyalis caffra]